MSKPDWAERLQRTFNRKYEAGVTAERERIIKLLSEQPNGIWRKYFLQQVIDLINGENNE